MSLSLESLCWLACEFVEQEPRGRVWIQWHTVLLSSIPLGSCHGASSNYPTLEPWFRGVECGRMPWLTHPAHSLSTSPFLHPASPALSFPPPCLSRSLFQLQKKRRKGLFYFLRGKLFFFAASVKNYLCCWYRDVMLVQWCAVGTVLNINLRRKTGLYWL